MLKVNGSVVRCALGEDDVAKPVMAACKRKCCLTSEGAGGERSVSTRGRFCG